MLCRFLILLCLFLLPSVAKAEIPGLMFADVQAKAQDLAQKPFEAQTPIPEYFTKLDYAAWSGIHYRADKALWAEEKLPFSLQFFHPGLYYDTPVRIHIVEGENIRELSFDPSLFQYGNEEQSRKASEAGNALGFAGLRFHFPLNREDYADEAAVFLGASYFRALAAGCCYGIYARGLAVDTAEAQGEEFPYFKEFWVVKPQAGDKEITFFALMDSPSLAGAYAFRLNPGLSTVMNVRCALYLRDGTKNIGKLGLAPLTSMFFYGEERNGNPDDFRPEVHNSDGLLFADGAKNFSWMPLANPRRLGICAFPLSRPTGFGLLQRDDDFRSYQDIQAGYERRPSLWVEPVGDWGAGSLQLVEIPTEDEYHDNIVAFWCPDKPKMSKGEEKPATEARYPSALMYEWNLHWLHPSSVLHGLGQAVSTRISRRGDTMTFHVDFAGGELDSHAEDSGLASIVETPEPVPILEKRVVRNQATGGWRLIFTVRLPKEEGVLKSLMAARKGPATLRFKALLKKGENLPDPLTETWIYDWQMKP